jgi:hypothetical protein
MESTASVTRTLDSHLELMRVSSTVTAILWGVALALSLPIAMLDVQAGSPRAAGDVVREAGLSLFFVGSLYMHTSRYEKSSIRRWHEWHRKSRAKRLRAIGFLVPGGVALVTLVFAAPMLVERMLWPGQGWWEYFAQAVPVSFLLAAAFFAGAILYRSADASVDY